MLTQEHQSDSGVMLSPELMEGFLAEFSKRSRSPASVKIYRNKLKHLYSLLPEDKTIGPGTLLELRNCMADGTVPNGTINILFAAANGLLDYCGRRDLQLPDSLEQGKIVAPELTRAEYLRLLSTAKALEKERAYLLVKLFVNTGINIRELPFVTVEAVTAGRLTCPNRGLIPISGCLRDELMDYCQRNGVLSGPVFITNAGKAIHRSVVNVEVKQLARDARVPEEKCNPITLKRLYLATQKQIMVSLTPLIEQSHDRLLETEQLLIGWEDPGR